jgi:hypothetical protein
VLRKATIDDLLGELEERGLPFVFASVARDDHHVIKLCRSDALSDHEALHVLVAATRCVGREMSKV